MPDSRGKVDPVFSKVRRILGQEHTTAPAARPRPRPHNLFEAAATHVAACAEDDQRRADEAAGWVSPEALAFGISELACRAVIALARERDESPQAVARTLLGLPAL
ncbi:hypothetical protein [Streptomyces odonnellii]|uniref:hypothetical protein n=1 Tax=Streptomyces odonnellii TaxID=1417980 RepID=UPI001E3E7CC5|nr:hypothetical protein [Streptomyces odonnellii]